jgi:hypothetical protein
MEALGMPLPGVTQIVEYRKMQAFKDMGQVSSLGVQAPNMGIGGNYIWTVRATARLRRPDGSPSEFVRTAAATVKLLDRRRFFLTPVHVLRWYDDAWSQSAIAPPAGAVHP